MSIPTSAPLPIPGLSGLPVDRRGALLAATRHLLRLRRRALLAWWLARTHAGLALARHRRSARRGRGGRHRRRPGARAGGPLRRSVGRPRRRNAGARAGRHVCRGHVRGSRIHRDRHRGARPVDAVSAWSAGRCCSARRVRCSSPFRRWVGTCPTRSFSPSPYLLTLAALAGAVGRARAPASLGQALEPRR